MKLLILCLSILLSTTVLAGFSPKYGQVTHIKYKPVNSPINFKYDVLYYIPAKLMGQKNLNALVFLHGGGQSTMTREGSLSVTQMYMSDLKTIADNLGIVLVMPSGSGNNWGGHMIPMLRDLNQTLRTTFPVDPNKIALSGHSMGGMGITRSAHWLADEYAFFLPTAAGMDEKHQTELNLRPYFNIRYYHMQGLQDHFKVFITRCENQQKAIDALEQKYNAVTGFELEFYNGSHNYPKASYQKRLEMLFASQTRNLYQTDLYGMIINRQEIRDNDHNKEKWYLNYPQRYFWLKGIAYTNQMPAPVIELDGIIRGNTIDIRATTGLKKLRVYLSSKLINLKNAITIKVNGDVKFTDLADLSVNTNQELKQDPGFNFDSYVDVTL